MGGEKPWYLRLFSVGAGSPPHGRGKVTFVKSFAEFFRITPAWAGKRFLSFSQAVRPGDHPRMGGEKCPGAGYAYNDRGSPPHGRGKGGYGWVMLTLTGITPAWAGKSQQIIDQMVADGDHPRMGGEKAYQAWTPAALRGSPPHGRGKVPGSASGHPAPRITPAWAGKRPSQIRR